MEKINNLFAGFSQCRLELILQVFYWFSKVLMVWHPHLSRIHSRFVSLEESSVYFLQTQAQDKHGEPAIKQIQGQNLQIGQNCFIRLS